MGRRAKGNKLTIRVFARKPPHYADWHPPGGCQWRLLPIGVALAGSVAWGGMAMAQGSDREYRLEYRLEAAGPATAKSAKVKFTLTNRARDAVRVLIHNTPLKGAIETRMFAVHCNNDDKPLRYQGLLRSSDERAEVVRVQGKVQGRETLKDTVLLNPGDSKDATVDLANAYSLPQSGSCKIAFTSLINVVDIDGGVGGQPKYDFVEAQGEPLVLPLAQPKE
jgi:hypothetical protein